MNSIVQGTSNTISDPSISVIAGGGGINSSNNKFQSDGIDPLFFNAAANDFHLLPFSPARDMGDNASNPLPTDLSGSTRISNGTIDIGPYELQDVICETFTNVVYVDSAASGLGNGSSWANAFTDLQDALLAKRYCSNIDTIKVAQGTYYPSDSIIIYDPCTTLPVDTILPSRSISFDIPDSSILLGGYGLSLIHI